jgi:hypothetical protein
VSARRSLGCGTLRMSTGVTAAAPWAPTFIRTPPPSALPCLGFGCSCGWHGGEAKPWCGVVWCDGGGRISSPGLAVVSAILGSEEPREAAAALRAVVDAGHLDMSEYGAAPTGPEPTRYGDWERKGRCSDF